MLSDEKQVMLGMIFERKAVPFSTSIKNHDDPPTDFFPYFSFFFSFDFLPRGMVQKVWSIRWMTASKKGCLLLPIVSGFLSQF